MPLTQIIPVDVDFYSSNGKMLGGKLPSPDPQVPPGLHVSILTWGQNIFGIKSNYILRYILDLNQ